MTTLPAFDEAGDGPPLILIHGHPFNRTMWRRQLQSLSAGLRVIALDLPGYGATLGRPKVTMPEFAAAVVELADHLRVERFAVAGLSMGGLIAMELGLRHPDRIAGVALVATTAAPVTPAEADDRRAAADRLERDGILDLALDMAGKLFGPAARRDPDIVEPVVSMMLRTSPAGAAAALRGRAERPDYATLLRDLAVPALVVAGDHDAYADEAVVAQLVDALPAPEVLRLPGVGHLPNLEAQSAFDAALGAFARRVLTT